MALHLQHSIRFIRKPTVDCLYPQWGSNQGHDPPMTPRGCGSPIGVYKVVVSVPADPRAISRVGREIEKKQAGSYPVQASHLNGSGLETLNPLHPIFGCKCSSRSATLRKGFGRIVCSRPSELTTQTSHGGSNARQQTFTSTPEMPLWVAGTPHNRVRLAMHAAAWAIAFLMARTNKAPKAGWREKQGILCG